MTERRITFDEIQKGDKIRVEWDDEDTTESRVGVAHHKMFGRWLTAQGTGLAVPPDPAFERHTIYLLHRPAPREPETSEIPVGTAGYATVRGVTNVRVMRLANSDNDPVWFSSEGILQDETPPYSWHHPDVVTNFRPDVVLTLLSLWDLLSIFWQYRTGPFNNEADQNECDQQVRHDGGYLAVLWASRLGLCPPPTRDPAAQFLLVPAPIREAVEDLATRLIDASEPRDEGVVVEIDDAISVVRQWAEQLGVKR